MSYLSHRKNCLKQRSYQLSIKTIKFISTLPKQPTYWVISDQLVRSTTSIGANIFEATGASSKRDFVHFYEISLKSAHETLYWLNITKNITEYQMSSKITIEALINEVTQIIKMISASVLTMKGKRRF